jgi:hypothetical protein
MAEKRILLIGGVGLVRGRIKDAGRVMVEICDALEPLLNEIGFVKRAPFRTVSLIIRFGETTDLTPQYDPIDRRHDELLVAVELEMAKLRFESKDVVKRAFYDATLTVLDDVARKFDLPALPLESLSAPME